MSPNKETPLTHLIQYFQSYFNTATFILIIVLITSENYRSVKHALRNAVQKYFNDFLTSSQASKAVMPN